MHLWKTELLKSPSPASPQKTQYLIMGEKWRENTTNMTLLTKKLIIDNPVGSKIVRD